MQRKMKSFHALNPFALYYEAYARVRNVAFPEFSSAKYDTVASNPIHHGVGCVCRYLAESWNEKISFILFYFRMASVPMSQFCNLAHFSIWILSWFCLVPYAAYTIRHSLDASLSSHFIHAANTSIRSHCGYCSHFLICVRRLVRLFCPW